MATVADRECGGTQASGSGQLQVTFAGSPAGNSTSCSAGINWPNVDTIDVLGLSNVDTSSVALTVWPLLRVQHAPLARTGTTCSMQTAPETAAPINALCAARQSCRALCVAELLWRLVLSGPVLRQPPQAVPQPRSSCCHLAATKRATTAVRPAQGPPWN